MAKKRKTFEEAITRLEEIARLLENNDIDLDDMVSLYKEGIQLSEFCKEKLEKIETEVNCIAPNDESPV